MKQESTAAGGRGITPTVDRGFSRFHDFQTGSCPGARRGTTGALRRSVRIRLVLAVLAIASPALADDGGKVVVKSLASAATTADGKPIRLPQGDVRVALSEYVIPPGAVLPVHKHPFTRLAYVLEGTLSVTDVDAGKTWDYAPGDLIVEVVDRWHTGTNTGTTPVRLLVVDQAPDGAATTVMRQ